MILPAAVLWTAPTLRASKCHKAGLLATE
jgi:hypothetical protein